MSHHNLQSFLEKDMGGVNKPEFEIFYIRAIFVNVHYEHIFGCGSQFSLKSLYNDPYLISLVDKESLFQVKFAYNTTGVTIFTTRNSYLASS